MMVQPKVRDASRKAGQNSPARIIKPWWFERREARRRAKVKGSSPPGPERGRPSRVTGPRAPSCEQHRPVKTAGPAPWWFQKREAKRKGLTFQKPKTEKSGFHGAQKSVREVVRVLFRPLLAELRSALKLIKGSMTRERTQIPFVKGGVMRSKPAKVGQMSTGIRPERTMADLAASPLARMTTPKQSVKSDETNITTTGVLSRGVFAFDYEAHVLKEKSMTGWGTIRNKVNDIASQAVQAKKQNRGELFVGLDYKTRNLILMYIQDYGVQQFKRFRHELEFLLSDFLSVKTTLHPGKYPEAKGPPTYHIDFPLTSALLDMVKDAGPSEVLSLRFGENQKLE